MELRRRDHWTKAAGRGHQGTLFVRLIYEIEESRKHWKVNLAWSCGTSPVYRAKAESRVCREFRRTYGHDLAPERIARMWSDYNDFRKEQLYEH